MKVIVSCDTDEYFHSADHGDNHPRQCGGEQEVELPELICEEHPHRPFQHDGCGGAGMPISNLWKMLGGDTK